MFPEDSPRVLATEPLGDQVGVDSMSDIVVRFDRALDAASVGPEALRVFGRWSGAITGTVRLEDENRTLRLRPDRSWSAGEWVTVTVAQGSVRAQGAGTFRPGYSWGFWARAAPAGLVPTHVATVPVRRPGEELIQTYGAYAGDFNEDGWSDLVVPNEEANDLRVFLNDERGGYGPFTVVPVPGANEPSTNEGADFDGDGHIDFAVGSAQGDLLAVFRGDGTGALTHSQNLLVGTHVRGACVLDFEGDGDPDLAAAAFGANRVAFFANDGRGVFSEVSSAETGDGEWSCAAADANGDGLMDLVVGARGDRTVAVLGSNGDGTFSEVYRGPAGGDPWMMGAGDLNDDGAPDIVAVNATDGSLSVMLGAGDGTLAAPVVYGLEGFPLAVDLGDLDGDGDLDVVVSDYASASFIILAGDGSGALSRQAIELAAVAAGSCAILHDRDGDGDLDVTGIDELEDLILLFENR